MSGIRHSEIRHGGRVRVYGEYLLKLLGFDEGKIHKISNEESRTGEIWDIEIESAEMPEVKEGESWPHVEIEDTRVFIERKIRRV